jgi:hypothetical protein
MQSGGSSPPDAIIAKGKALDALPFFYAFSYTR